MEVWLTIKDYDNYLISSTGRIYNKKLQRELKPCKHKSTGYLTICLSKNGKYRVFLLHRLVAQTFLSNPFIKPQVNHKNSNKLDNSVDNLEWVTAKENNQHSVIYGNGSKGAQVWSAKLSDRKVINIKKRLQLGYSLTKLAKEYGVSKHSISKIKNNKTWKHIERNNK